MTIRSRFTLAVSAAALSLALAAPALAEEMGKGDGMSKPSTTTNTMSNDKMGKDPMSKPTTTGTGMSKEGTTDKKPDPMSPPSGGMSK